MRRLGTAIAYWVVASASSLALFGLGLTDARLLVPLGRVLLFDRPNGWRDLRDGRRWAEAISLTAVWGWLPWLIDLAVGRRLVDAVIRLPWMPDAHISGSVVWWWVGAGVYFGLLHRRVLAALIGGALALICQWAFMGPLAHEVLRALIPSDLLIGYLVFGLFMGLMLGAADFLAGLSAQKPAPNPR